jgi:predicted metal-dependent hydrolase
MYLDGESHLVWGQSCLLQVVERAAPPGVATREGRLALQVRPGTGGDQRQAIVAAWYRDQIKVALPSLLQKWEPVMEVKVAKVFVQQMKTRWGSCNTRARNIRINSELAKQPRECLEYVVVHELAHLLEASHNRKFYALLDHFMPHWRDHRDTLNRLPLGEELWT